MFLNPLFSLLVLVFAAAVYFLIRWKHRKPLLDNNDHVQDWKWRWWARIVAFRSWVAACIAAVLLAAPDLIVAIAPIDFSPFIGENYARLVSGALAAFLTINNAMKTKPDGVRVE